MLQKTMSQTPNQGMSKLLSTIQSNSNVQYLSDLKTIQPGTTGKDLTERQKHAFQAMMRIALDPTEKSWAKRKEKLDRQWAARMKAESQQRMEMEKKCATEKVMPKRKKSLKAKIRKMRAERRFPTKREIPEDAARRYGFIPRSQRKVDLQDYAKV